LLLTTAGVEDMTALRAAYQISLTTLADFVRGFLSTGKQRDSHSPTAQLVDG
jgi:hypothetical protein